MNNQRNKICPIVAPGDLGLRGSTSEVAERGQRNGMPMPRLLRSPRETPTTSSSFACSPWAATGTPLPPEPVCAVLRRIPARPQPSVCTPAARSALRATESYRVVGTTSRLVFAQSIQLTIRACRAQIKLHDAREEHGAHGKSTGNVGVRAAPVPAAELPGGPATAGLPTAPSTCRG